MLPRGSVSQRCFCKDVLREFQCASWTPEQRRKRWWRNSGRHQRSSGRNVNDRMPDLIRRWITGGRKRIALSFNCFLFWQQVIISSSEARGLFHPGPNAAAHISVVNNHKRKLWTDTQIVDTFGAAGGRCRATVRRQLFFPLFINFKTVYLKNGPNGQKPNGKPSSVDVLYVSRCDTLLPSLHSSCGVTLFSGGKYPVTRPLECISVFRNNSVFEGASQTQILNPFIFNILGGKTPSNKCSSNRCRVTPYDHL